MLSMFGNYATSEAGIDYIQQTTQALGGADVFKGNQDGVLKLVLKTMLNAGGHQDVYKKAQENGYKNGEAAVGVAREAVRTLLFLPTLSELQGAEKDALPEKIKGLVSQYQAIVAQIKEKLG